MQWFAQSIEGQGMLVHGICINLNAASEKAPTQGPMNTKRPIEPNEAAMATRTALGALIAR